MAIRSLRRTLLQYGGGKRESRNLAVTWSEWRVKLCDCVEQKNCVKIGNAWEKKYAEFKICVGRPERGTPLFNWQMRQLSNGADSLNAKIRKEIEKNEGST